MSTHTTSQPRGKTGALDRPLHRRRSGAYPARTQEGEELQPRGQHHARGRGGVGSLRNRATPRTSRLKAGDCPPRGEEVPHGPSSRAPSSMRKRLVADALEGAERSPRRRRCTGHDRDAGSRWTRLKGSSRPPTLDLVRRTPWRSRQMRPRSRRVERDDAVGLTVAHGPDDQGLGGEESGSASACLAPPARGCRPAGPGSDRPGRRRTP